MFVFADYIPFQPPIRGAAPDFANDAQPFCIRQGAENPRIISDVLL